jgi:HEAT repeat protein
LREELRKTKEVEFASVLCIALGLGTHTGAVDDLIDRADSKTLPAMVRAAAAQGLGLMGKPSPKTDMVLFHLLTETNPVLVEDAALALGLLGRRSATKILLNKLAKTQSSRVRGGIIQALGHLGNPATIDPLLAILSDRTQKKVVREYAAVALGLIVDTRSPDVLFEIDADFNLFATTVTTNELIRLY